MGFVLTNTLLFFLFLYILIFASKIFVEQSVALAHKLKLSEYIIGFALVSMGTSIPELSTGIYSASLGHTSLAVANVLGSNITNISLILGMLAILKSFRISKEDIKYNIPLLLFSTLTVSAIIFLSKFHLSPIIGILMIAGFFLALYFANRKNHKKNISKGVKLNLFTLFLSLLSIVIFSKFSIDGVIKIADFLNIKETFFGFIILALGTSLPELITTVQAIRNGNKELGLGNILGSNMFNLLFVLGVLPILNKTDLSSFKFELIAMVLVTIALYISGIIGTKYYFSKREGFGMIGLYILYILFVLYQYNIIKL